MLKCKSCGKRLEESEEGKSWRRCSICKKPICLDDIHYIASWVRGLYRDYIVVIPVCEDELPRKRLKIEVEQML